MTDTNTSEQEELSPEELELLDERRRKRLAGESKTYTWEEAKSMILSKNQKKPQTPRGKQ